MAAKRFGVTGDEKSGDENMMNDYLLKPQLDSIFAEVESNLPNIDFEVSDVRRLFTVLFFVILRSFIFLFNSLVLKMRRHPFFTEH